MARREASAPRSKWVLSWLSLATAASAMCKLLLPRLAEGSRGGRIEAEEHVGFEAADGAGEVRVDVAAAHDDGQAAGGDDIGEVVGFLDADMRRVGAEKHGDDEKAGAEAELGFKFHDGPYLRGDAWVR